MEALLAADFELGHFFRERLIPRVFLLLRFYENDLFYVTYLKDK